MVKFIIIAVVVLVYVFAFLCMYGAAHSRPR